jgi:tetratricopeptide (TPR) repeat protein
MSARTPQVRQVLDVLNARQRYPDAHAWFEGLLALLPKGQELEEETERALESHLRGGYGAEYVKIGDDLREHLRFWKTLAERFPEKPKMLANYADTLLLAGQIPEAMDTFLAAFQKDPVLVYKFGGELHDFMKELGGPRWLEYQLTLLRAALAEPEINRDYIRETLDSLRREFKNDPEALRRIDEIAGDARGV